MGDPLEPEGVVQGSTLRFLARFARAATDCIPLLAGVKVLRQWAGCYDVTPDNNPVLGPAGFENFLQLSGFVGHGFMMAPAMAELYADLAHRPREARAVRAVHARPLLRAGGPWPERTSSSGSATVAHGTGEENRAPRHGQHGRGPREGAPAAGTAKADEILCTEPRAERREEIAARYGVTVLAANVEAVEQADVLVCR